MKNYLTILAIFISIIPIASQNLVINGDMEQDSCGFSWPNWTGWNRYGSSDFIHVGCQVWSNHDYTVPYEGRACYGTSNGGYGWHPSTDTFPHREYLIGTLSNTLEQGKNYYIKYMVKPGHPWDGPWLAIATDRISLAFISDLDTMPERDTKWDYILDFEPDITNPHGVLYDYENYIAIEDCYTARGDESYFVLGNFLPWGEETLDTLWHDRSTVPASEPKEVYGLAYVLIDNVEVWEVPELVIADRIFCDDIPFIIYKDSFDFESVYLDDVELIDSIVITESGTYHISAHLGYCRVEDKFDIDYVICNDCDFYIPNLISTQSGDIDDHLLIGSNCAFEIESAIVYDRWGSIVYESDTSFDWDGSLGNKPAETGVYIYDIKLSVNPDVDPWAKTLRGTVTLYR